MNKDVDKRLDDAPKIDEMRWGKSENNPKSKINETFPHH